LKLVSQNDFFDGGSFPIPDAEAIVAPINSLRDKHFNMIFVCTTQHPLNHSGFGSNNPVRRDRTAAASLELASYC
jgi:hypothetical protein